MESLNASLLNVVLKIREGSGFGFLTSPFVIVCNLNGNVLTSDPIPCSANPTFESDFVWEAEKKFLRSMRSNNYSIRVEFFSDAKHKRHDKIGYILLNMKQQAQIVSPKLGKHVTYNWHKLLGVRNDAKSCKPEILLSLFIKEADFELGSKTPKTPPPTESVTAGTPAVEVPTMEPAAQDAVVPTERSAGGEREVQVGTPRDSDSHFKLQVRITSVFNLASLVCEETGGELRLEFALFGECHRTADLSTSQGPVNSESITLHIKAQLHSLAAYFSEFPSLYFLVQTDGRTISKAPFDMKRLVTLERCEELTSGRMSVLREETKLFPDNQTDGGPSSYFTVLITLQHERTKVNNPIKPFTISSQHKKGEKVEFKAPGGGNKIQIKGVHCKTKNNSAADTDCKAADDCSQPQTNLNKQPQIAAVTVEPESQQINMHSNAVIANECNLPANGFPPLMNLHKDLNEIQNNQQRCMNNFSEIQNFNPPPQNMNQFVYPYFQQTFPYHQDGRGDLYGGGVVGSAGQTEAQATATLTDSVKAKITDELARKTYDELEDWKEKQKESYKTDLKKKLEKEVKRLTAEWLSRQNELEREATSNIEESVLLSQQLHCTSSELKVRLEAVNKQQIELEKEREGLDKKYAERHQQMKETSKQQQTVLQQQVTSLKGEVEELRTKICSLMKENEMLRCLQPQQTDGRADTQLIMSAKAVSNKSTHLTEQQMTALLVDMKSLEEKLSAAVESKEFFRKEWSRALREIHRMKTEQEQQVRLQLQAQRQELDNLRLVGLIASDDKCSKDDLASIRDLKSQIVRLNTPKSS